MRPFSPAELAIDETARGQAFYRLRRYSSLTYVKQTTVLLQKFIGGFDAWARKSTPDDTFFARKALKALYPPLAALEEVPSLLLTNQKTAAYDAVMRAGFLGELLGFGFDQGLQWVKFGFGLRRRPSTGLFAWAEKAVDMAARMRRTAAAEWNYTRLSAERPAPPHAPLDRPPDADGPVVEHGDDVPITGVWLPIDVPNGCPNFLVEGVPAPTLSVETTRIDTEGWPGDASSPPMPARTEYLYSDVATRWRLAWEDIRYRAGVEIEEPEFLDEETELPAWPPVHSLPS